MPRMRNAGARAPRPARQARPVISGGPRPSFQGLRGTSIDYASSCTPEAIEIHRLGRAERVRTCPPVPRPREVIGAIAVGLLLLAPGCGGSDEKSSQSSQPKANPNAETPPPALRTGDRKT